MLAYLVSISIAFYRDLRGLLGTHETAHIFCNVNDIKAKYRLHKNLDMMGGGESLSPSHYFFCLNFSHLQLLSLPGARFC